MPSRKPTRRPAASPAAAAAAALDPARPRPHRALPPSRGVAATPHVREALDALRQIVQALRVGRAAEHRSGLSSAQLFALQQISEHPDASVNDVAALTFTHQSSVSVVIQRLVRQRLVAKLPAPDDRRRHRLALTAKGRQVLNRAPVAVQEHLIAAIASLPAANRRILARTLGEIGRRIAPTADSLHPPMFFEAADDRAAQKKGRRTS